MLDHEMKSNQILEIIILCRVVPHTRGTLRLAYILESNGLLIAIYTEL
jgi:hypothetical protein